MFSDLETRMFNKNMEMRGLDAENIITKDKLRVFFKEIKESNMNKDFKFMFTSKEIKEGSYIKANNNTYLTLQADNNFNNVYNKYITAICNQVLKFKDINNKVHEVYCIISNNVLSVNDNPSNIISWDTSKIYCLVGHSLKSSINLIKDYSQHPTRFIIGGKVWETENKDTVSKMNFNTNGLYVLVLKRVTGCLDDDFENEIANNIWDKNDIPENPDGGGEEPTDPEKPTEPEEKKELKIIGKHFIYQNLYEDYSIENNVDNLQFEWFIDDIKLANIEKIENGICRVRGDKKNKGYFILTAKNDSIELQKKIHTNEVLSATPPIPEEIPPCVPTPPEITLIGDKEITLENGVQYKEEGVTITDDKDKDLKPTITFTKDGEKVDRINTTIAGTYTIYYNAIDTAGNKAKEVIRTVIVKDKPLTTPPFVNNGLWYVALDSVFTIKVEDNIKNEDYTLTIIDGEHRIKNINKIDKDKFEITTNNKFDSSYYRGNVHFKLESASYICEVIKVVYRYGDNLVEPKKIPTKIK